MSHISHFTLDAMLMKVHTVHAQPVGGGGGESRGRGMGGPQWVREGDSRGRGWGDPSG